MSAPAPLAGKSRLPGVDVLRGLAVLLVLLHHIHLRFEFNDYDTDGWLPHSLNQVLWWSGYQAVIAFFVISGFLITRLSIGRWGPLGHIHIGAFYALRVARILPCLLLLLLVLSTLHLIGARNFIIPPEVASLGRALLAALTFHINYLEGHHGYLPGGWDILWSLSVEETFYLLFPLICALVRSERLLIGPLLCLIVIGPISRTLLADQDPWGDYAYFSCTDGIAFGCLTALACARWRIPAWVSRIALPAGAAGVLFVLVMRETVERIGLTKLGLHISVLELGVALMLLAFGTGFGNEAVSRGTGWLRRIGHHSYETYLFHMIVVLGLMNFVLGTHASSRTLPAWFAAMLLLSLGLGEIVARRYSEPLNRRLRTRFVAGKPTVRVSYLELRTAPGHQAAESGAAMIALERLATEDYLALYRRVGAQVRWDQRLQIPLPELESLLAGNDLRIYVLRSADGSGLGLCEFDRSGFPDIELKNFGVVPEAQGRGLGRRLLATALAREWETGLQRVWLHTDSWDHPAAMRLYSSLGFRVFEERDEPVGPL